MKENYEENEERVWCNVFVNIHLILQGFSLMFNEFNVFIESQ